MTISITDENDAPCAFNGDEIGSCPTLLFSIEETQVDGASQATNAVLTRGHDSDSVCVPGADSSSGQINRNVPPSLETRFQTTTGSYCFNTLPYWKDQDAGDILTFRMCPEDTVKDSTDCTGSHDVFNMLKDSNDNTVKIELKLPSGIDYETKTKWNAIAVASDGTLTGVGNIIVKIIDVNEPPTYTITTASAGKFSLVEVDVLTKLDSIADEKTKKVLCEQLSMRVTSPLFEWKETVCDLVTPGEKLGDIEVVDVDIGSSLTVTITAIKATFALS